MSPEENEDGGSEYDCGNECGVRTPYDALMRPYMYDALQGCEGRW